MSLAHDVGARALRAFIAPEPAHEIAVAALAAGLGPRARADAFPNLRTRLAGLDLANPIGLAAGFDKNAAAFEGALRAGFGFVECGTVTPRSQAGNPRPRLFRLTRDRAVINRMGFNNDGLDVFTARLARRRSRGCVGANVGANKDSVDRAGDYVVGLQRVWAHCDYVTANVSSPNTPGLRGLQERGALEELLGRLAEARAPLTAAAGARPLFLKIAPDLDDAAIDDIVACAVRFGLDGLIVSNTTVARDAGLSDPHARETGGLSGRPLFPRATAVLKDVARASAGRLALIGVGGIEDAATALAKIKAGAHALQLYSALAYEGPGLVARIAKDLSARLAAEGFRSVADAVGADLERNIAASA